MLNGATLNRSRIQGDMRIAACRVAEPATAHNKGRFGQQPPAPPQDVVDRMTTLLNRNRSKTWQGAASLMHKHGEIADDKYLGMTHASC